MKVERFEKFEKSKKIGKKRRRADACLVLCGVLIWFLADAERVRRAAAELKVRAREVVGL